MRLSALAALMIITTVVLSACKQETVAALDDHSTQFFGRNYVKPVYGNPIQSASNSYAPSPAYVPVVPSGTQMTVTNDAITSSDLPPPSAIQKSPTYVRPTVASAITPVAPAQPRIAQSSTMSAWYWPVEGKVIEDFQSQHEGIVIAAKKGAPIHVVSSGEVAYVGSQLKEYGNLVIIRHPNGDMTSYAHASEIIVSMGDKVKQGDVLGYVGQTGRAPVPELHFAVRANNQTVDPMTRLPQNMASN